MALKDKLMFWKKSDDFDFDLGGPDPLGVEQGQVPLQENIGLPSDAPGTDPFATEPSMPSMSPQAPSVPSAPAPSSFSAARDAKMAAVTHRDIELISSKLDTIKAILQSLDQRVGTIEQIAKADQAKQQSSSRQNNRLW